jgi:DNA (cytosine-5)-methyltransferase 1
VFRAISLYTGVGGLDFGFEEAGFETVAAVELDPVCCRTVRLNRPAWCLFEGDIHAVPSSALLEASGMGSGEVDVLIGGPPCQPFSKSGYWHNGDSLRLDDHRATTLSAYLRILEDVRPRAFLLENVKGLAYRGKDEGLREILDGIQRINRRRGTSYVARWDTLNAAAYGVPQMRERVFVVGSRDGIPFRFPHPTHGEPDTPMFGRTCEPLRTAWDALGDLPRNVDDEELRVGGKWGMLLPSIPEGENYLWHTPRGGGRPLFGWRTRYWNFLLKLAKNRPAWTIQASPGPATGPFHWRSRRLSARELCRLQTFPDGLLFDCAHREVHRMLGNAVPSLLAEVLAGEIKAQLLGAPRPAKLNLLPPRRDDTPPPERVARVPVSYLHLQGNHEAHPGTGQGPSAARRPVAAAH